MVSLVPQRGAYAGQKKGRDADERWLSSVLSSGTIADKLSAMVIQVQASPVHRLHLLDSLMNLATKKGKRQALLAIDTLQELWTTSLLPARKLVPLGRRPLLLLGEDLHGKRTLGREEDALLLMWYFEDQLKRRYFSFAHTLNKHANDALATIRTKVVGTAFDLLASYPEQEQFLLTLLANKLGDPERTLAAKASHLLTRLTQQHPNMKTVVVKEVGAQRGTLHAATAAAAPPTRTAPCPNRSHHTQGNSSWALPINGADSRSRCRYESHQRAKHR